jgi:hypothetical protein
MGDKILNNIKNTEKAGVKVCLSADQFNFKPSISNMNEPLLPYFYGICHGIFLLVPIN